MEICGDYGGKSRQTGKPCKKPAGWGVKDKKTGKCKLHGGASTGRPIEHGRYSVKHRERLQENLQQFLNDPRPGDLREELALMRALLKDFLDRFPDGIPLDLKSVSAIYSMAEDIGRMVERISRILNQAALTQADLKYLQVVLTDLLIRYIDDPDKRIEFMAELRRALGGDASASRSITQIQV